MCNGIQPLMLNGGGVADVEVISRATANQNAPCTDDLVSLEALFVNIQGLMNMAVEKARQREQQIIFEKGRLYFAIITIVIINNDSIRSAVCIFRRACAVFTVPRQPEHTVRLM